MKASRKQTMKSEFGSDASFLIYLFKNSSAPLKRLVLGSFSVYCVFFARKKSVSKFSSELKY